jgi:hypothetical protein
VLVVTKVALMPSDHTGKLEFHRGSCICPNYVLRITQRCLTDDLQFTDGTCFENAMRHPIVKEFVAKHHQIPVSGKTVGSKCGARTLYRLGIGNDHRGAIWHDAVDQVVWLCGYGLHRSGEHDDAFQMFRRLLKDKRMYPVAADYRRLYLDRQRRFDDMAPAHAIALREAAMSHPGIIQTGILGQRVPVRVVVVNASSGVADLTIAISTLDLNNKYLNSKDIMFIARCFAPEGEATLSEFTNTLGGMPLLDGETAVQIMTPA